MKKLVILGMVVMMCGVFGCKSSTSNDSSIDPDLVGTWVQSSSSEEEKLVINSDKTLTRYAKYNIIDANNYTIENMEGTYTTNTSSNPKIFTATYKFGKITCVNSVITTKTGSESISMYYKVENSKLYTVNTSNYSSSGWADANVCTKQ